MNDPRLSFTIGEMYRLAYQYSQDVAPYQLRSVYDIFDFVRRIPYTRDVDSCNREECLKRPSYGVIEGDCDDKSIVAGAALSLLNIPWRFVTTSRRDDEAMQHVYLEISDGGEWRAFDATYPTNTIFQVRPYTKKIVWDNPMMYDNQRMGLSTLEGLPVDSSEGPGMDPITIITSISSIVSSLQNIPLIGSLFRGKTQHESWDIAAQKADQVRKYAYDLYMNLPDESSKAYFLNLCKQYFENWVMPDLGHRWDNTIGNDFAREQLTPEWANPWVRVSYYLGQPLLYFMILEDITRLQDSLVAWYTTPVTNIVWTPLKNYLSGKYGVSIADVSKGATGSGGLAPGGTSAAGFGGVGVLLLGGLAVAAMLGGKKR